VVVISDVIVTSDRDFEEVMLYYPGLNPHVLHPDQLSDRGELPLD
jgi:hypothetical protein